ncbi:MAG: hypothetical protein A2283_22955 [Lentisphaerae bacterium RIFOXYA12_FULL_48_11]|nr:MAG: hypothetical protein A2283_22955 [Lentisphaerae bacterium RIFOXYA12_FULL_48_11]
MKRGTKINHAVKRVMRILKRCSDREMRCCIEFFCNRKRERQFNRIARTAGIRPESLRRAVIKNVFNVDVGEPFYL